MQCSDLQDHELLAGAAIVLAGYSSGTGAAVRAGERQSNSECGMRNSELGTRGMALSGILVCRRVIYAARKKHSAA